MKLNTTATLKATAILLLSLIGSSVAIPQEQTFEIESVLDEDESFFGRTLQDMSMPPDNICIDFQLSFEVYPEIRDGLIVPGNPVRNGDYISNQYFDAFGILMESTGGEFPFPRIFDSSNPNPLDLDLGTPHRDFGGPGRGEGGRRGAPGENSVPLGNLLIIQEDDPNQTGNSGRLPNDKLGGGTITFDFTRPVRFMEDVGMIDISDDMGETNIEFTYSTTEGGPERFRRIDVDGTGNNGVSVVPVGLPYVRRMNVNFGTSGGITFVNFCANVVRVGFGEESDGSSLPPVDSFANRKLESRPEASESTVDDVADRNLENNPIESTKTTKGRKLFPTTNEHKNKKPPRNYTRGANKKKST